MILKIKKKLSFASGKGFLDVDTRIEEGTFVAISGTSGSGKTTLLRLISGLEKGIGKIEIKNSTWLDSSNKINLPPQKRSVGYVFQNYALFPNMTVQQNLLYALEKTQAKTIVDELIETMELSALAQKYPYHLSGGQQQRVALARALVRKPYVLLLDEPLSALGEEMRNRLQSYILKVHKEHQLTTILVSHSVDEILKMADQVIVLEEGKITQKGTPEKIFLSEKNNGKYQFKGEVLEINPLENTFILKVKLGDNFLEIEATKEEISDLKIGNFIDVMTHIYKPVILK